MIEATISSDAAAADCTLADDCSDAAAPVNGLMTRRTFQVDEYAFTSLPQKPGELFEPAL